MRQSVQVFRFLLIAVTLLSLHRASAAQDKKVAEKKGRRGGFPFQEIRLRLGRASDVVFSADGKLMAVGVAAKVVVFKVGDGEEVVRLQLPEPQTWHRLVFGAGGK